MIKEEELLRKNFLFAECTESILSAVIKCVSRQSYTAKSIIHSTGALGILLEGKIEVSKNGLLVHTLKLGDSFGIAALFGNMDKEVSTLTTVSKVEVLFITEKLLEELFKQDFSLAKRYIAFQADRICYLNQRLEECSGNNVLTKLAAYIMNTANERQTDIIKLNYSKTAAALNIGRASLYRALAKLEEEKLLSREGNITVIIDKQGLNRIIKNEEDY